MAKTLYLGLHAPKQETCVHLPIIKIIPLPFTHPTIQQAFQNISYYTHLIFTSQSAVSLFFDYTFQHGIQPQELTSKIYVAVGSKTATLLRNFGMTQLVVANEETAEGVLATLEMCNLKNSFVFWPHSALSRPLIKEWLTNHTIPHQTCAFYNTTPNPYFPRPELASFDEIVFTSPSTIDAFLSFYDTFPSEITFRCIGPITQHHLETRLLEKSELPNL